MKQNLSYNDGQMKLGVKLEHGPHIVGIESADTIHYPDLHVDDAPEALHDAPDEGTATVKYKIVRRTKEDRGKKERYSCTIEIHDFEPEKKKEKEEPRKRSYGTSPLDKTKKRMDDYMESKK